MALPPKTDPRRPIFLAASSMRLLGGLLILLAALLAFSTLSAARYASNAGANRLMVMLGIFVLVYGVAGVAFIVSAIFVVRRRQWAVILGLVLTGIELVLTLFAAAGLLLRGNLSDARTAVPLCIVLLFTAAFTQLAVHLGKSLSAIALPPWGKGEAARGFEVIRPADPAA